MSIDADGGISLENQEAEARERADEIAQDEARAQRWAEFVSYVREHYMFQQDWSLFLYDVTYAASLRSGDETHIVKAIRDFADAEGWPAVLRAIARALEESQR